MKVIIVDDEPRAIELLIAYLRHFEEIEITGTFRNGLKAFEFLNKNQVDFMLLDINMPHISGVTLARMLSPAPKIIFTTAYSAYAVESYEMDAVDYLMKPISLERFAKAIRKVQQLIVNPEEAIRASKYILLKSGDTTHRVQAAEILYLKKEGNYMTYYLDGSKLMTRESVNEALQNLPAYFVQVHKSYIINKDQVNTIKKDAVMIAQHIIPIGLLFKDQFLKIIAPE